MKRLSGAVFAASVLLALAAVAAARGSDGSDERAREYFEEIVQIVGRHGADVEAAQATYDAVLQAEVGEEEEIRAFLRLLDVSSKSIRAQIAEREMVEPPEEIEEAHLELLSTARVLAKIYEDALEGASDVTTDAKLTTALRAVDYGPRLEEAEIRAVQACTSFQALATEAGIEAKVC